MIRSSSLGPLGSGQQGSRAGVDCVDKGKAPGPKRGFAGKGRSVGCSRRGVAAFHFKTEEVPDRFPTAGEARRMASNFAKLPEH